MRKLGIIDHHAGNLFSLENAQNFKNFVITNNKKF